MFKVMKWALLATLIGLIASQINIEASIYKAADNSVEIIFPQWQTEEPWFYVYWTPGTLSFKQQPREKKEFESKAKTLM
ncbi:MAG: hypothetical protein ACRCRW_08195 [Aeromonadaceae bacterium]